MGWEKTITILFIGSAFVALLRVGQLGSFVTQLGIAALIVSLLFLTVGPNLGKHSQWILVGVGLIAFYFGSVLTTAMNFKIQALNISQDVGVQTSSLLLLIVLLCLGVAVCVKKVEIEVGD